MTTTTTAPAVWVTERDWRQTVVDYARLHGWRVYFAWRSDHSPAGFPDLTLVRGERLVFAELKRHDGKLTEPQEAWLADLGRVAGVAVFCWKPVDWPAVQAVLA